MKLLESLEWRYAVKKFDESKKIPNEDIVKLKEALRLSPSSYGLQPWHFIVIENKDLKDKLREVSWNQGQITECSHLIIFCHKKNFNEKSVDDFIESVATTRNVSKESMTDYANMMKGFVNNLSHEELNEWARRQTYLALGHFLVTCAMMGIDACPMEGFLKDSYDEILSLKNKDLGTVVICPIGYRNEEDHFGAMKKVRFPIEKIFTDI